MSTREERKRAEKGIAEKSRVSNNGRECIMIKDALGLPQKTSKVNVLKAAVEFFVNTYKDQDFSVRSDKISLIFNCFLFSFGSMS